MKINDIIKTETYVELDGENGGKFLMPTSATILVDDNSNAISVKTTGSRKTVGYMVSGGTPPVPPTPTAETTYSVTLTGRMPHASDVSIHFGSYSQEITELGTYTHTTTADSISFNITIAGMEDGDYLRSEFNPILPLTLTSDSPSATVNIDNILLKWRVTGYEECHGETIEGSIESATLRIGELSCVVWVKGMTLYIGNCVKYIDPFALSNCIDIFDQIQIGSGLTEIGMSAFYNTYINTMIVFTSPTPPALTDTSLFDAVSRSYYPAPIMVRAEYCSEYRTAPLWSACQDKIGCFT